MATLVQDARRKLELTVKEREAFAAEVMAKDEGPSEDDERKLDAMLNGEADLRTEVGRLEKFVKAESFGGLDRAQIQDIPNPARQATSGRKIVTMADMLLAGEEYLAAMKAFAPNGQIGGAFKMPAMQMNGLMESVLRHNAALVTGDSSTSGGAFIITDRDPELIPLGRKPVRVLDLISKGTTESDLVDYVAETSRTNAAAIRTEATTTSDPAAAADESAYALVVRQAAVNNVANYFPVTKQAFADAPQMRGIINQELLDNLIEKLCDLVVNGTSPFVGLLQTSNIQTQAWSTNILTTTRKAKTIVGTVGREIPNAYVLNPADWETIDLLQDNEARYFYGGPSQVGVPRLWGLPVAEEEAVASGTGIVGNLMKAKLWDRQQATISVSDSHSDWFVKGILAVLADLRAAFALRKPTAIVSIDLTA